ncbi:uncharacterized protein LY89DRAFT_361202 [Mollisia scopiformis]|uniref:Uncharacterized protein n=1 Tax=Mollisia scopiformis TaxID=149040 RepID=A0A132B4F1_MOLSC|nr:uncharacterized protein LY89DRAFT_361202 [Mollisia scopiformis]KUJ07272.1 hypothetical protein LY89DRAFT_361202 [Mollisia scopiformis]
MLLKDHEQKPTWSAKRAQRCLSIAVIFVIILFLGLTSQNSWPRKAELKLSKIRPYTYGSTPEAGRPTIPFVDNPVRKSTEDPFFDVPYIEDDYDYDDVAQEPIQPRDLETKELLSREELEAREGKLIGLH